MQTALDPNGADRSVSVEASVSFAWDSNGSGAELLPLRHRHVRSSFRPQLARRRKTTGRLLPRTATKTLQKPVGWSAADLHIYSTKFLDPIKVGLSHVMSCEIHASLSPEAMAIRPIHSPSSPVGDQAFFGVTKHSAPNLHPDNPHSSVRWAPVRLLLLHKRCPHCRVGSSGAPRDCAGRKDKAVEGRFLHLLFFLLIPLGCHGGLTVLMAFLCGFQWTFIV